MSQRIEQRITVAKLRKMLEAYPDEAYVHVLDGDSYESEPMGQIREYVVRDTKEIVVELLQ